MHIGRLRKMRFAPALLFAAVPLTFLIAIAMFELTVAIPEAQLTRAQTVATFQTSRDVTAVDETVQDAERGQRGFLITGREIYLEPYEHAKAVLPGVISQLRKAIG